MDTTLRQKNLSLACSNQTKLMCLYIKYIHICVPNLYVDIFMYVYTHNIELNNILDIIYSTIIEANFIDTHSAN